MKRPLRKTLRLQLENTLQRLEHFREAILTDRETDAIHDFRVALRNLIPALDLLLSEKEPAHQMIVTGWQSLRRLSGPARDAEVVLAYLAEHPADSSHLPQWQDAYLTHRKRLMLALESPGIDLLLVATGQALLSRVDQLSKEVLHQRIDQTSSQLDRRLRKQVRQSLRGQPDWHTVRLSIKRYRYWHQLTEGLAAGLDRQQVKRLLESQTVLGQQQDLTLLSGLGLNVNAELREQTELACLGALKKLHRCL